MSLFGLAAWIGLWLATARITKLPLAVCALVSLSVILIVLVPSAMLGLLWPVAWAIFIVGLAWLVVEVFSWRTTLLSRPEVVVFAGACVLAWWYLRDTSFASWDDFSHWGLTSIELLRTHRLPGPASVVMLKDYPPAESLFHYFDLRLSDIRDGAVISANALLLLLPIAGLAAGLRWFSLTSIASGIVVVLVTLALLEDAGVGYQTAMIDSVLGSLFATILISYFVLREANRSIVWLVPALFVFPLFKDSGVILGELAVLIIAADLAAGAILVGNVPRRTVLHLGLLVAAPVLGREFWQLYLNAHGYAHTFHVQRVTLTGVRQTLLGVADAHSNEVRDRFLDALASKKIGRWATPLQWIELIGASMAMCIAVGVRNMSRGRLVAIVIAMGAALAIYLVSLLIMYLMLFSPGESSSLASFERYCGTILLGLLLLTMFFIVRAAPWAPGPIRAGALVVLALVVLRLHPVFWLFEDKGGDPIMTAFRPQLEAIMDATGPDSKIMTIAQHSNGAELVRIRFGLAPRRATGGGWTFGKPYDASDIYTLDVTEDEFLARVKTADFVFLARTDRQFWDRYGRLFGGPAAESSGHYLYRVSRQNGDVTLLPVL